MKSLTPQRRTAVRRTVSKRSALTVAVPVRTFMAFALDAGGLDGKIGVDEVTNYTIAERADGILNVTLQIETQASAP